jgi:hypothetical protein
MLASRFVECFEALNGSLIWHAGGLSVLLVLASIFTTVHHGGESTIPPLGFPLFWEILATIFL